MYEVLGKNGKKKKGGGRYIGIKQTSRDKEVLRAAAGTTLMAQERKATTGRDGDFGGHGVVLRFQTEPYLRRQGWIGTRSFRRKESTPETAGAKAESRKPDQIRFLPAFPQRVSGPSRDSQPG